MAHKDDIDSAVLGIVAAHVGKPTAAVATRDTIEMYVGDDWLDLAELLLKIEEKFQVSVPHTPSMGTQPIATIIDLVRTAVRADNEAHP